MQVHSDHAMAITLRHTHNIGNATEAYLQFAMLYSNPNGQRCIRCSLELKAPCTRTQVPHVHHSRAWWSASSCCMETPWRLYSRGPMLQGYPGIPKRLVPVPTAVLADILHWTVSSVHAALPLFGRPSQSCCQAARCSPCRDQNGGHCPCDFCNRAVYEFPLCRVHNLGLPIASLLGGVFRCADLDATLNLTAHRVALEAPGEASERDASAGSPKS